MIDALEGEPAWNELNDVTSVTSRSGSRQRERFKQRSSSTDDGREPSLLRRTDSNPRWTGMVPQRRGLRCGHQGKAKPEARSPTETSSVPLLCLLLVLNCRLMPDRQIHGRLGAPEGGAHRSPRMIAKYCSERPRNRTPVHRRYRLRSPSVSVQERLGSSISLPPA